MFLSRMALSPHPLVTEYNFVFPIGSEDPFTYFLSQGPNCPGQGLWIISSQYTRKRIRLTDLQPRYGLEIILDSNNTIYIVTIHVKL